jgi:hypothetical protein
MESNVQEFVRAGPDPRRVPATWAGASTSKLLTINGIAGTRNSPVDAIRCNSCVARLDALRENVYWPFGTVAADLCIGMEGFQDQIVRIGETPACSELRFWSWQGVCWRGARRITLPATASKQNTQKINLRGASRMVVSTL